MSVGGERADGTTRKMYNLSKRRGAVVEIDERIWTAEDEEEFQMYSKLFNKLERQNSRVVRLPHT